MDGLIGCVQCQKDTYQILDETIATPVNEALLRMQDKGRVTIFKTPTGAVKICFGDIVNLKLVLLSISLTQIVRCSSALMLPDRLQSWTSAQVWEWR